MILDAQRPRGVVNADPGSEGAACSPTGDGRVASAGAGQCWINSEMPLTIKSTLTATWNDRWLMLVWT